MSKIFFTADHHFGDANIIKLAKRPFESVDEMNEIMIHRWNEKVSNEDHVYHLGDITKSYASCKLLEILNQLQGKIHLVKGNHDTFNEDCRSRFEWIRHYHELKLPDLNSVNNKLIVLMHYPMMTWRGKHSFSFHLYGHSHGKAPSFKKRLAIDVGVDCHNFYPISYEDIIDIMDKKT